MLSLSTIFTLMMLPGVCMLAASFVVGLFENECQQNDSKDSQFLEADAL